MLFCDNVLTAECWKESTRSPASASTVKAVIGPIPGIQRSL